MSNILTLLQTSQAIDLTARFKPADLWLAYTRGGFTAYSTGNKDNDASRWRRKISRSELGLGPAHISGLFLWPLPGSFADVCAGADRYKWISISFINFPCHYRLVSEKTSLGVYAWRSRKPITELYTSNFWTFIWAPTIDCTLTVSKEKLFLHICQCICNKAYL